VCIAQRAGAKYHSWIDDYLLAVDALKVPPVVTADPPPVLLSATSYVAHNDTIPGTAKDFGELVCSQLQIGRNNRDCIVTYVQSRAPEIFAEGQITTAIGIGKAIATWLEDKGYKGERGGYLSAGTIIKHIPAGLTGGRSKNGKKTRK
jgi:hypothetical protein